MDFFGNVNVVHGSVQAGRVRLGTRKGLCSGYPHDASRAAFAFIRSHELEILRAKNGRPSFEVEGTHVNSARSVIDRGADLLGGVWLVLNVDVLCPGYAGLRLQAGRRRLPGGAVGTALRP
jgi:hypothetical protein